MTSRIIVLALLWGTLLLTSCGPEAATLQMTVESQVAAAVRSTVAAIPTATANSTYTPYPTFTPPATFTPYATYTPQSTFTPQPTFTLPPTNTPLPTNTPEPSPTATATRAPESVAAPPVATQPTAPPQTDMQAQVLAAIDNLLNAVDAYVAAITAQFSGGGPFPLTSDDTVKCEQLINAYNQGINTSSLDVSQAPDNVQNGYNVYLTAVPLFQEATHVWAEVCQAALASGEARQIGDQDRGNISHQMDIIKNMLNNVANELRTP